MMPVIKPNQIKTTYLVVCITLCLSACSTVSVKTKDTASLLLEQRSNIITGKHISTNSAGTLLNAGIKEDDCFTNFNQCITDVNDSLFPSTDNHTPRQLAVMAELYYAQAQKIRTSKTCKDYLKQPLVPSATPNEDNINNTNWQDCLQGYQNPLVTSIKYSYAYLFYNNLNHLQPTASFPNERDIQTLDIYNVASSELINYLYAHNDRQQNASTGEITQRMMTQVGDTKVTIHLPNNPQIASQYHKIDNLIPTSNIQLKGLNSVSKQAGIGVNYVAQLTGRYQTDFQDTLQNRWQDASKTTSIEQENKPSSDPTNHIYTTGNLLLTAVVQPTGSTQNEVLSSQQLNIFLYDPYQQPSTNILGVNYPLTANFSASYGSWIEENQLKEVTYLNMLYQKGQQTQPYLFMLEPYNPNKQVIIMLHGLASSPMTWVALTNDILNDEALRAHYQVWQVFYPTNLPMLENRYQIQTLIESAYQSVGANSSTTAGNNSVIIGHSMGGVISRMMLSNNDLSKDLASLNATVATDNLNLNSHKINQFNQRLLTNYQQPNMINRFKLHAIPQVDTAVFIAAPHRGTQFADLWFTKALRKIIRLPLQLSKIIVNSDDEQLAKTPLGSLFLQNGASQLSDKSAFMTLTSNINIDSKVTYHSIMGKFDNDLVNRLELVETEKGSDGIVPYESSHLAGASSESVLAGSHNIHTNPKTILLLRKILHEHMAKYPIE